MSLDLETDSNYKKQMINLKEVITKYPECLESAGKLRSYLCDLYPDEKLYAGILSDMLADGMVDEIRKHKEIDTLTFNSLCDKIENNRGLAHKHVEGCLNLWANAFDIKIKTPPAPQKLTPVKRTQTKIEITDELHEHKYKKTVIPPTCTEKGYTLHYCDCGYEYKDTFVNPKHDFVLVEYKEPTCEKNGKETYKCAHCSEEQAKDLPATGHKFGKWIESRKPTCTEKGLEVRQCSKCGKKEQRSIDKTGHKFTDWRIEGDLKIRDCLNCGLTETIDLKEERRKEDEVLRRKAELVQAKMRENEREEKKGNIGVIVFFLIVLIVCIVVMVNCIKTNDSFWGFISSMGALLSISMIIYSICQINYKQ